MSDGRFKFSTEQQQAAFVHRQAGAVLPYYEAARVANSFYAKQHGCGHLATPHIVVEQRRVVSFQDQFRRL